MFIKNKTKIETCPWHNRINNKIHPMNILFFLIQYLHNVRSISIFLFLIKTYLKCFGTEGNVLKKWLLNCFWRVQKIREMISLVEILLPEFYKRNIESLEIPPKRKKVRNTPRKCSSTKIIKKKITLTNIFLYKTLKHYLFGDSIQTIAFYCSQYSGGFTSWFFQKKYR